MLTDVSVKTPEAHETTGIVTFNIVGTQNTYNAAGKRVQRVENAETTKFYYTGDALLYSTDAGNVLQTENILDLGGTIIASKRFETPDQAATNEFANKYYLYNYDVRGSVTNIIGPDGNTVIGYDYDEFGNTETNGSSSFLNDVTFTSSVADTSSSLQYMNARFYQPSTGRFLSQQRKISPNLGWIVVAEFPPVWRTQKYGRLWRRQAEPLLRKRFESVDIFK